MSKKLIIKFEPDEEYMEKMAKMIANALQTALILHISKNDYVMIEDILIIL